MRLEPVSQSSCSTATVKLNIGVGPAENAQEPYNNKAIAKTDLVEPLENHARPYLYL